MSDYQTNFPPQTYSSSFYLNALAEGDKAALVTDTDDSNEEEDDAVKEKNSTVLDCFISTMNPLTSLVLLVTLGYGISENSTSSLPANIPSSSVQPPQINTCIEDPSSKIRTFNNLGEYQDNRYSFNPKHPTYNGNIVEFTTDTIDQLETNDFNSFGSDSIIKLDLHQKAIQNIDVGAFKELFCLSKLDLSYNHLSNFTEGSFEGLENLKELDLSYNILSDIPDSGIAFIALTNLQILNLSYNNIQKLSKLSFMVLYKLEILNLGHNKIRTLDDRVFNSLGMLKQLYLDDNLLVDPLADKWKGLESLINLDVSNNNLSQFDTKSNFSFFNLKMLNLSGNQLQDFDVFGVRQNLPNLEGLDLSSNSWFCEDWEGIRHHLEDNKIALSRQVDCHEIKTSPKISNTTFSVSTPTASPRNAAQVNFGPQLLEQNIKLTQSNNAIKSSLEGLRSMMMFLFVIILICIALEFGSRMGVFRNCFNRFGGRNNRGYLDSNDVESVGLIRR